MEKQVADILNCPPPRCETGDTFAVKLPAHGAWLNYPPCTATWNGQGWDIRQIGAGEVFRVAALPGKLALWDGAIWHVVTYSKINEEALTWAVLGAIQEAGIDLGAGDAYMRVREAVLGVIRAGV